MFNNCLIPCFLFLLVSAAGFGQQAEYKLFKGDGFEISYPQNWTAGKDGKLYVFYLDQNLGDISISVYKNSNFPSKTVQKLVLELNEKRTKSEVVKIAVEGNNKEYSYAYVSDGIKWFIKAVQNKKDLFLITLNWNIKDWEAHKAVLNQSFNSFKIK